MPKALHKPDLKPRVDVHEAPWTPPGKAGDPQVCSPQGDALLLAAALLQPLPGPGGSAGTAARGKRSHSSLVV